MMTFDPASVQALTFDVFGTVVDWRGSIIAEGKQLNMAKNLKIDWARFADAWRGGYEPAMQRVRKGELPWLTIDRLHRMILDQLLVEFNLTELNEADKDRLNRVWHRLNPWPDAVLGLQRLRGRYVIATLSNGNIALLTNMAKHAGLPWDCILSAELAKHYKPDPEVYLTAAELLGLAPTQVLMVAAHPHDLAGAKAAGLKTAYIPRPLEYGPIRPLANVSFSDFDVVADNFSALADKLGC
jgi:2-haloacid dehalogenase